MTLAIRGHSAIAVSLSVLVPHWENVVYVERGEDMSLVAERYFICQGFIQPKTCQEQTPEEQEHCLSVNYWQVKDMCDRILAANFSARICIMGSESGYAGSYDGNYASAKAQVHRYVETTRLRSRNQQLICIAPSIIGDAGMTERRVDRNNLERRKGAHPKERFLSSGEVARLARFVLYDDFGYLTNVVIRMNGGAHTCQT